MGPEYMSNEGERLSGQGKSALGHLLKQGLGMYITLSLKSCPAKINRPT